MSPRAAFVPVERRHLGWAPPVDAFSVDAPPRAVVHGELPGVDPATIDLEVHGRQLVVRGTRPADDPDGRLFQQVEIARGPFRRVVELGALVAQAGASARYDAGILEVTLPLEREEPRTRTVRVEGAA